MWLLHTPVARDAWVVVHDGHGGGGQPVEQRALAHVGAADDRNLRSFDGFGVGGGGVCVSGESFACCGVLCLPTLGQPMKQSVLASQKGVVKVVDE